jgi:hypothetical protein
MTTLKQWMDAQWESGPLINGGHGNIFLDNGRGKPIIKAGAERKIALDAETKRRQAGLAMYHPKLAKLILAEATVEMRPGDVRLYDERKRYISSKKGELPHYTWPKEADAKADAVTAAPDKSETVPHVPRKRVSHKKVTQAAAILAKVPEDELTAFLARFGLSLSLAASIASLDNVEQIARQFLRATL